MCLWFDSKSRINAVRTKESTETCHLPSSVVTFPIFSAALSSSEPLVKLLLADSPPHTALPVWMSSSTTTQPATICISGKSHIHLPTGLPLLRSSKGNPKHNLWISNWCPNQAHGLCTLSFYLIPFSFPHLSHKHHHSSRSSQQEIPRVHSVAPPVSLPVPSIIKFYPVYL